MTRKTITRVETVVECVFDAEYEHDILKIFETARGIILSINYTEFRICFIHSEFTNFEVKRDIYRFTHVL